MALEVRFFLSISDDKENNDNEDRGEVSYTDYSGASWLVDSAARETKFS